MQSINTGGSAVGALFSGPLSSIGKHKCLLLTNVIVIIGSGLTLIQNYPCLLAGRFLYGVASGAFSVFCPKYIAETSPIEVKGVAGSLTQICITFGILVSFTLGLAFPTNSPDNDKQRSQKLLFIYSMYIIPIVIAVLNIGLLLFVFPFDTPPILKQRNEFTKLNALMSKIYKPHAVQGQIDDLGGDENEAGHFNVTYRSVFCSSYYRKATFVGISMAAFQQFTGINVIMFYSNTIFKKGTSLSSDTITALVGSVNFVTTLIGMWLLSLAGRKTIMLWTNAIIAVCLILLGYLSLEGHETSVIILVLAFISLFEFGPGPITWLYMSEIMQDKAVSIATVVNWMVNLLVSATIPAIIKGIGEDNIGWIFIVCGGLTAVGFLFMACFMEETRGKTNL